MIRRFASTYRTEGGGRWRATWWQIGRRIFRQRVRPA